MLAITPGAAQVRDQFLLFKKSYNDIDGRKLVWKNIKHDTHITVQQFLKGNS